MSLRINDTVPNLKVISDMGDFYLHEWIGDHWAILFSHPKDFTPVCTTEFGAVASLRDEWEARNTKVIGISVDNVEDHKNWKKIFKICSKSGVFPYHIRCRFGCFKAFGMFAWEAYLPDGRTPNDTATVRSVFIIGPDKALKLSITYPMTVGRNFAEVLRALDALQLSSQKAVATPADWQKGEDVIIPATLSDEEAEQKFGPFNKILPFLR